MAKNAVYHESAVLYNQKMATAANELVDEVEDPDVKKWCRSVAKQHEFHLERHEKSLDKLTRPKTDDKPKKKGRRNNRRRRNNRGGQDNRPPRNRPQSEQEKQAEFAAQQEEEPIGIGVETVLPEDQKQEANA